MLRPKLCSSFRAAMRRKSFGFSGLAASSLSLDLHGFRQTF